MDRSSLGSITQIQSHPDTERLYQATTFFRDKPVLLWGALLVLFLIGLVVRVNDFEAFQIGDRQFRSALIARAYYFRAAESIPEWRRQVAEISQQRAGFLEPPIMEVLVSWIYQLINREHLWIPRFLSSVFWVIAGAFLYKIVERIVSVNAAVFAAAYYLFVPMGVYISTGFVPDSLMIMMFLLSIFMIIRHYDHPSKSRLVVAAVVSALAILVKPFCLFATLGAFISLAIYRKADWRRTIDFQFLTFLGIILLPVIYYAHGIFAGGLLSRQAQASVLPYLLLTRSFWWNSLLTASGVVGFTPLIAALIGLPMVRKGMSRALLIGLWAGYAVFCLVFTYHVRFGPHYHSQLIIIVAISIGPLITLVTNHLRQLSDKWYWWLPVIAALGLITLFNLREVRSQLAGRHLLDSEALAQEIGEIVGHSSKTVYLAHHYGTPLEYYGELSGSYWPRSISDRDQALGITRTRSVEERLSALNFSPEYFIITNFSEFNSHHVDLKEYLANNCPLVAASDQYLIYGACTKPF